MTQSLANIARYSLPLLLILIAGSTVISSFDMDIPPGGVGDNNLDASTIPQNNRPDFPSHWGHPPLARTRDLVALPGDYGRGSGTLKKWILTKMAEDGAASRSGASSWPDKSLVGMTGEEAKRAILAVDSSLDGNVNIVPHDAMVTMDYREDRVRIFVGDDGKVVRQPNKG